MFSDRCIPFIWLGPKWYTDRPCDVEDINILDAVVISHNHYDHLDHPTITKLAKKHPTVHFFCPLGNKQWFTESGIQNVTELDWWDERDIVVNSANQESNVSETDVNEATKQGDHQQTISARIGCLPCQHTSARTGFDKGMTLWSSWCIESGGRKVRDILYPTTLSFRFDRDHGLSSPFTFLRVLLSLNLICGPINAIFKSPVPEPR